MSLRARLRDFWYDQWDIERPEEVWVAPVAHEPIEMPTVLHQPKGKVVKTQAKQYSIDQPRHGGRMVKTMPKNLRHLKELSEKTDD